MATRKAQAGTRGTTAGDAGAGTRTGAGLATTHAWDTDSPEHRGAAAHALGRQDLNPGAQGVGVDARLWDGIGPALAERIGTGYA